MWRVWLLGLWLGLGVAGQAEDAWQALEFVLEPNGQHRARLHPTNSAPPGSRWVFTASSWPAELVPIFEVERNGHRELRRRPPLGRENTTDPLFFARAPTHDPTATALAGRWQIQATNVHGGKHWTFLELTVESGKVAGRFDPHTDYRFAFMTGGDWKTNRLQLNVEYIQDRYELTADGRDGKLSGTWRQPDDSEHGTWTATRAPAPAPPTGRTEPLWEWRRADGIRRYGPASLNPGPEWERSPEPLCEVWLP
ncbi:MAG: hypothetical protein J0M24_25475 [Verrucomicrobia bacterium]|nr:hypothetical protein [Verrucomicrobiota bacterium]